MMRKRRIIQPRQTCSSSFLTTYGIGITKARRLSCFLLNHPSQTKFARNFRDFFMLGEFRDIFSNIPTGDKIRLFVCKRLIKKIMIFPYQMVRLFQNLPQKGQRTKANAGTPSHFNSYLSLNVNYSFYPEMEIAYKRRELVSNERFEELKAFDNAIIEKEKMKKSASKAKKKAAREQYMKSTNI